MTSRRDRFLVIGIDLAGVPHRPSGICLLEKAGSSTGLLYKDEDILAFCEVAKPSCVAIDAPLHLPPGRRSLADRNDSHFRPCDLELRQRKIPFFPITLGPMRALTERGIRLKRKLEKRGIRVVEIYPGGAQDIWGFPRAKRNMAGLLRGLRRLGIRGLKKNATDHELDAATGALVGLLFLRGEAEVLGDFSTGAIVMPRRKSSWKGKPS